MTPRIRKLVGTIALLAFIVVYALVAMAVAMLLQVGSSKLAELVYYVVAGLAWTGPAAWLIHWMYRKDGADGR